jgi:hypothetical protein
MGIQSVINFHPNEVVLLSAADLALANLSRLLKGV